MILKNDKVLRLRGNAVTLTAKITQKKGEGMALPLIDPNDSDYICTGLMLMGSPTNRVGAPAVKAVLL